MCYFFTNNKSIFVTLEVWDKKSAWNGKKYPLLIEINIWPILSLEAHWNTSHSSPQNRIWIVQQKRKTIINWILLLVTLNPHGIFCALLLMLSDIQDSMMLQKSILCKNELYFLSHVTVNCLWVCCKNCHTSCGKSAGEVNFLSFFFFFNFSLWLQKKGNDLNDFYS